MNYFAMKYKFLLIPNTIQELTFIELNKLFEKLTRA